MARIRISEYASKRLLLGESYSGISITSETIDNLTSKLTDGHYVVKVDTGIKKRNQKGLVLVNVAKQEAITTAEKFLSDGYARVLIEPFLQFSDAQEEYVSLTLTRAGIEVLYSSEGGVDVESGDTLTRFSLPIEAIDSTIKDTLSTLPQTHQTLITSLYTAMHQYQLVFIEINPFVCYGEQSHLLDSAVELDSSYLHRLPAWIGEHVIQNKTQEAEVTIATLNERSQASFALTVLREDAPIYTLLSGGGASLVTLDVLVDAQLQDSIGNYGEYSGAPTREETEQYTNAILSLLLASKAPRKILIVAGGVANFTDISITFSGIVDALTEHLSELRKQDVLILVRRGGPRHTEGLAHLEHFCTEHGLSHIIAGPEKPLATLAVDAKQYLI